jgi:hypothetical protein
MLGGLGLVGIALYFLPTIVALAKSKHNTTSIALLNFFLGWTFVGWVIAMVSAVSSDPPSRVVVQQPIVVPSVPASLPPQPAAQPAQQRATKLCPFCAEMIMAEARKCRFCGENLPENVPAALP